MTGSVTQILRHPIKSHGREAVARVVLQAGQTLPWDRTWAVVHARAEALGAEWARCSNFCRAASSPQLMAISAALDEANATVTLTHPVHGTLTFRPDDEGDRLINWARKLIPEGRPAPTRVVRAETRGFTDSSLPTVSLCNRASHRAVEQRLERELSIHRWRGNIWFDGLAPWQEFDWIDREVRIGGAVVIPRKRTERCVATHANPDTGKRDADILRALKSWGHRDFGVLAEVVEGGAVVLKDGIGQK